MFVPIAFFDSNEARRTSVETQRSSDGQSFDCAFVKLQRGIKLHFNAIDSTFMRTALDLNLLTVLDYAEFLTLITYQQILTEPKAGTAATELAQAATM